MSEGYYLIGFQGILQLASYYFLQKSNEPVRDEPCLFLVIRSVVPLASPAVEIPQVTPGNTAGR